jgi:hypothetical protein
MENNIIDKFGFLTDYKPEEGGKFITESPQFCDVNQNTNNRFRLQSLNEISVKRFLNVHYNSGFIVISACRSDWDIENVEKNREINNKKSAELENKIVANNFSYIPVWGGYKEKVNIKKLTDDEISRTGASLDKEIVIGDNVFIGEVNNIICQYNKSDVYEKSFIVLNYNRGGGGIGLQYVTIIGC